MKFFSLPMLGVFLLGFWGCAPSLPPASLTGTVWKLEEMGTLSVRGKVQPTLQLDPTTMRASGFAGINRFSGSYTLDGAALSFGPLMMTRMGGDPELMAMEGDYSKTLSLAKSWQVTGKTLQLLAEGQVLARFTAGV